MKRCSCNWCERTEENCKDRFKRIDNRWYCSKHYQQLKRHGKPFKWMYKEYYDLFIKLNEYYKFDNKGDNKYE